MSGIEDRRKTIDRPVTEHECMIKFYEPVDKKQKQLKKAIKKPE